MINSDLWKKIEAFDLDNPISEYGFSTRLANENEWAANFTTGAICEYKKFMFLAATSEFMISPSEIVDVVWHQHLVFTQSYTELCNILGRKIEHLPSTRNKEDAEKFKKAKERTKQYYNEAFGEQPTTYWNYTDIYKPLALDKAKIKNRTFLLFAVCVWFLLLVPGYIILKPFYITIADPQFLAGYIAIAIGSYVILGLLNRHHLNNVVEGWSKDAFVFDLTPMELVYLKRKNVDDVIHGYVSHMIEEGNVEIKKNKLSLYKKYTTKNPAEFVIAEAINDSGQHGYSSLLNLLKRKPAVTNVGTAMDAFEKYIIRSRMFYWLYSLNVAVPGFVLLLGAVRMITGLERDKPVGFLFFILVAIAITAASQLNKLGGLLTTSIIPGYYKQKIIPQKQVANSWDWDYCMLGTAVLAENFMPLYNELTRHTGTGGNGSSDSGGCGSGCGSSCGSGCGGSCGGCGGG